MESQVKSRLWPVVLFGVALLGLQCLQGCVLDGCGDNLPDTATLDEVADAWCSMAYCGTNDDKPAIDECRTVLVAELQRAPRDIPQECADALWVQAAECPDFRPLPAVCEP
jgi:hypothetical protein